jgi:hypothetical protein
MLSFFLQKETQSKSNNLRIAPLEELPEDYSLHRQ